MNVMEERRAVMVEGSREGRIKESEEKKE